MGGTFARHDLPNGSKANVILFCSVKNTVRVDFICIFIPEKDLILGI